MRSAAPIVFLGPSLPLAEARRCLDADYRPPVRRGDLDTIEAGRTLVIIDGEFGQSLSVSPKEILRKLDAGVRVLGAASMGALRAVELAPLGMLGCGRIYEAYRAGRIDGDDEVALMYSARDYRAETVPLVNVRFWVEALRGRGLLDTKTGRSLLMAARRVFFADRTPARLRQALAALVGEADLARLIDATGGAIPDVKADDTRQALAHAGAM